MLYYINYNASKILFHIVLCTETFPLDKTEENYVRQVNNAVFSKVFPIPLKTATHLVALSGTVSSDILDLAPSACISEFFKAFVSGNTFLPGSVPLCHRYGGHQVNPEIYPCHFQLFRHVKKVITNYKCNNCFCNLPFEGNEKYISVITFYDK